MRALFDFVAGSLPGLVPFPAHPGGPVFPVLLALLKKEPVRVTSLVLAGLLILVATVSGVSLPVLLGELAAAVIALEKVRAVVAPMVDVVVHADDVPAGSVPAFIQLHDPDDASDAPESDG